MCSTAAEGDSTSLRCSARGTYQISHCEKFGLRRLARHRYGFRRSTGGNGGRWEGEGDSASLSVFSVCFLSEIQCQLILSPPSGGSEKQHRATAIHIMNAIWPSWLRARREPRPTGPTDGLYASAAVGSALRENFAFQHLRLRRNRDTLVQYIETLTSKLSGVIHDREAIMASGIAPGDARAFRGVARIRDTFIHVRPMNWKRTGPRAGV